MCSLETLPSELFLQNMHRIFIKIYVGIAELVNGSFAKIIRLATRQAD